MFNFPDHPVVGQTATVPNGSVFLWDGVKWGSTNAPGMFVPRLDSGKQTVVVNNTGTNHAPVLAGFTTPQSAGSDYLQIQPYALATADGSGNLTDGAAVALRGKTHPTPNQVDIFSGNNALTYQRWQFQPNGNMIAPGSITLAANSITLQKNASNGNVEIDWGGWADYVSTNGVRAFWDGTFSPLTIQRGGKVYISCNVTQNDPLELEVPNGHYARIRYNVAAQRVWSAGCDSSGRFAIADESGGTYRYLIDTSGNHTFTGQTFTTGAAYFMTSQVSDFYIARGGTLRVLNWGANWYDWWNDNGGLRGYTTPNGNVWNIDGGGNSWQTGNLTSANGVYGNYMRSYGNAQIDSFLWINGGAQVGGEIATYRVRVWDMGISYTAWGNGNHVAWNWTGSNLQCYIDFSYVGFLFSDARVKDVVGDYERGLSEIMQLKPVCYKLKGNDRGLVPDGVENRDEEQARINDGLSVHDTEKVRVGVIAQETETIIPEMFTRGSTLIDGARVDDVRLLDEGPWLTYALINAVKELKAEIETLKGERRGKK